jgi:nucleotide-binding universal stress UspA family protein
MSYHTIAAVITDLTVSTVVARYALALAASSSSRLILCGYHEDAAGEMAVLAIERHLNHLAAVAAEMKVTVTTIIETGSVATLLPRLVLREKVELLFYPLPPYKRYGVDQERTVTRALLRSISCDLAIVRIVNMVRPHPGHLLVPLGRTVATVAHRVAFIAALAHCFSAQVTLYHLTENLLEQRSPDIAQVRELLEQQQVTVLERNGSGTLGNAITLEVITHHNDLIVLGASVRSTVRRIFCGNPVADVMQQPPCNTVLFRAAR